MRFVKGVVFASALAIAVPAVQMFAQDADRKVAGGGITAAGWKGKVDADSGKKGMTTNDSKFAMKGSDIELVIGPPAIYWNPQHVAKGDYTVKATFKDMKSEAGHAHPVGLFIGGSNLETDQQQYLYCVAYTDGSFLIRQFNGLTVATVVRKAPNAAVKGPGADGLSTNEVAWSVKGGKADCLINGTSVASLDQNTVVTGGKLNPVEGIYGLRVAHNMRALVSGFGMGK